MSSLMDSDLGMIEHLDREVETKSGVISATVKNELIRENRSAVTSEKRFGLLERFVREQLKRGGRGVLGSDTWVKPYK